MELYPASGSLVEPGQADVCEVFQGVFTQSRDLQTAFTHLIYPSYRQVLKNSNLHASRIVPLSHHYHLLPSSYWLQKRDIGDAS